MAIEGNTPSSSPSSSSSKSGSGASSSTIGGETSPSNKSGGMSGGLAGTSDAPSSGLGASGMGTSGMGTSGMGSSGMSGGNPIEDATQKVQGFFQGGQGGEVARQAQQRVQEARSFIQQQSSQHPLMTAGVAMGAGLLIGMMMAGNRGSNVYRT